MQLPSILVNPPLFNWDCVAKSLYLVVFCRHNVVNFVGLFLFWPLHCLFFALRWLITHLVSSNLLCQLLIMLHHLLIQSLLSRTPQILLNIYHKIYNYHRCRPFFVIYCYYLFVVTHLLMENSRHCSCHRRLTLSLLPKSLYSSSYRQNVLFGLLLHFYSFFFNIFLKLYSSSI